MTKKEFLKTETLKLLGKEFKQFGFTLNYSKSEFTKKTVNGWQKFQLIFLLLKDGWEINPAMLLRVNQVEDIFHNTSGFESKYQKLTPTIGIDVETFMNKGNSDRFELNDETQIDIIANQLKSIFNSVALPFFNQFSSLNAIDKVVNENLNDTNFTGSIFKGSKGIIIAKLIKRSNFTELEKYYTEYYKKFSDGFYLSYFNNLISSIK